MIFKRQRWTEGAILNIDAHGYSFQAQMLKNPEMAFFNLSDTSKVLFRLWVHKSAYSHGRWRKIDVQKIPEILSQEVPRFKKDVISGKLSIYRDGIETPAKIEECLDIECAAIWDAEHIEDRLRDQIENRENKWLKSLGLQNDT